MTVQQTSSVPESDELERERERAAALRVSA